MSTQANAAREILGGIYAGLGYREPSEALQRKIDELEDQIAAAERSGRQCRCNAHVHGGDCMCFEE